MKRLLLLLLLLGAASLVLAREAVPMAEDPLVEQRLTKISEEMRCLVCQNESLAASRSDLANDLRAEIRKMIKEGKSNEEIMDFMVSRYGDFVRYRPPLKGTTYLLWFGPFLFLLASAAGLVVYLRRRRGRLEEATLSAEEIARAQALLKQD